MPGLPSTVVAATASRSSMPPSVSMAYVEIVPSPKLVTNTVRPSLLIAAQQTSLRVLPTGPLSGASCAGPPSLYDEADALPACAPAASAGGARRLAARPPRRFGHDQNAVRRQVEAVGRRPRRLVRDLLLRPSVIVDGERVNAVRAVAHEKGLAVAAERHLRRICP